MSDARFAIWAMDHGAWWRAGERGYTPHAADAGAYSAADVARILSDDVLNEQRVIAYDDRQTIDRRLRLQGRIKTTGEAMQLRADLTKFIETFALYVRNRQAAKDLIRISDELRELEPIAGAARGDLFPDNMDWG